MSGGYRFPSDEPLARQVRFTFNERELVGLEGEPIAAALLANGVRTIRHDDATGEPRGVYCGIGHCFECRAQVDGVNGVRTCLTPLREGTRVASVAQWDVAKK